MLTGATGVVGSALVQALHASGAKVYALCRVNSPRIKNIERFAEVITGTLSEYDEAIKKIKQADAFFHLGWEGTTGEGRNDVFLQQRNIKHTLNAVEAAYALGCPVFLGAGSQAEYGRVNTAMTPATPTNPETGYGMAKLCAGQLSRLRCEQRRIRHVWARLLSVYGENDRENSLINYVIGALKNHEKPRLTSCEQIWDYMFSADAARALLLLAERGDGFYPVGSGEARELKSYVEIIKNIIDPEAEIGYGALPYDEHQAMCVKADITALKKDVGFAPSITFATGIKRVAGLRTP